MTLQVADMELFDSIEFEEIEPLLETVLLKPGATLCRPGDDADRLWIVAEGKVRIGERKGNDDVPIIRYVGEVIGEQAFIEEDSIRTETITAAEPCRLISLSRSALYSANDHLRERLTLNIARVMSGKLREATGSNRDFVFRSGESKEMLTRLLNPDGFSLETGQLKNEYDAVEAVIWFSDIIGFTQIANKLEPEDVGNLVIEVMSIQSEAIKGRNGFIDKFQGDGVMAYWPIRTGGSSQKEDAVHWALDAAEESLAKISEITNPADRRRKMGIRIGLHLGTDSIIRGNFGSKDRYQWTLIGADINFAAELEHAQGDSLGPIRISEPMHAFLGEEKAARYDRWSSAKSKSGNVRLASGPA